MAEISNHAVSLTFVHRIFVLQIIRPDCRQAWIAWCTAKALGTSNVRCPAVTGCYISGNCIGWWVKPSRPIVCGATCARTRLLRCLPYRLPNTPVLRHAANTDGRGAMEQTMLTMH